MADDDGEDGGEMVVVAADNTPQNVKVAKSKLDSKVQNLLKLIFDHDMFKAQMETFKIDTKKMPLGKLSHAQILKGYDCLEKLEKAVESLNQADINQLSSQFYTLIPHSFGRNKPPGPKFSFYLSISLSLFCSLTFPDSVEYIGGCEEQVRHAQRVG